MRLSSLLSLSALLVAGLANSQDVISGSGPRPPALVSPAKEGDWKPKASTDGLPQASLDGMGRRIYMNSANDFCLLMPPDPVNQNLVEAEAVAVAYCHNPTNGTRPMPDGLITGAHYLKTDKYVQITGSYNPAVMNLAPNDCGGEYDSEGAEGIGNPVGVTITQGRYFFNFVGACDIPGNPTFCMRMCPDYEYCDNRYDLMGCLFVSPSDSYEDKSFSNCQGDAGLPVGVFNSTYTFRQGMEPTPTPVAPPASSCSSVAAPASSGVTYTWNQLAGSSVTGSPSTGTSSRSNASPTTSSPSTGNSNSAAGSSLSGFGTLAFSATALGLCLGVTAFSL